MHEDHLPEHQPVKRERPAVSVDIVSFCLVSNAGLQVLLIRRRFSPFEGMWAAPGGFVEIDESLEQAAVRELAEETGIATEFLEQLHTFSDPDRDPRTRVITVAYLALVPPEATKHRAGDDAAEARWFGIASLPELAFDHQEIIDYALARLRDRLQDTAVVYHLLPRVFTLTELQGAYEAILGESLDKRNFRRKMLASGTLENTGRRREFVEGRPAILYRYRADAASTGKLRPTYA